MSELALPLNDSLDLRLSVAGPGARAYAFLLDFKFRLLAALLWLGVGMTIFRLLGREEFGDVFKEEQRTYLVTVLIPTLVIYFLYHPLFELLWSGRTPGKILAGVRVVDLSGRAPSALQILVRNVFRLIDSMPAFYALGLVLSFFGTARARIGDIAAGTVLVHDTTRPRRLATILAQVRKTPLTPAQWDFASNLLQRWPGLMPAERERLALEFFRTLDSLASSVKPKLTTGASTLERLRSLVG